MRFLCAFVFTYRGALLPLALIPAMILPWSAADLLQVIAGTCMVALGMVCRVLGVRMIGGRARVHTASARDLITGGIFGHVRNPLYVGNMLTFAGLTALFASLLGGLLALLFLLGLYTLIAFHEERSLTLQIGAPYQDYMAGVPRWFFRLRPYRGSKDGQKTAPWGEVLKRERYFMTVNAALVLLSLGFHGGLIPLPLFVSYPARRIVGTAMVVLVSAFLLFRVGARIRRKRGGWLEVEQKPLNDAGEIL